MCKVSICIPAYMQPEFLGRCLQSIDNQTFKDYEIIITDDSPDESVKKMVDNLSQKKLIKYFKNKSSLGSPANWNEAISKANGEYIKILHHDDWFTYKSSLNDFVRLLNENPLADIAFSGSVDVCGEIKHYHYLVPSQAVMITRTPEMLFEGNIIGAPSAVIFRNKGYKFDNNLKWLVDIEFYIRLLKANNHFVYSTKPLVSIGINENQVTRSCERNRKLNIKEHNYVFKKMELEKNQSSRRHLLSVLCRYRAPLKAFLDVNIGISEFFLGMGKWLFCTLKKALCKALSQFVIPGFKHMLFEMLHYLSPIQQIFPLLLSKEPLILSNASFNFFEELLKPSRPIFLIIDDRAQLPRKNRLNLFLQLEPESIIKQENYLLKHHSRYDHIITYNERILKSCPNAKGYHLGCSWIERNQYENIDVNKKKLAISTVIGHKNQGKGHFFRQLILHRQSEIPLLVCYRSSRESNMDNPYQNKQLAAESKLELFTEYQYSLVIENARQQNYFSEKLIDCLITKTIPFYYGDPNISQVFDTQGWIILENESVDDVIEGAKRLNENSYMYNITSVMENYRRACQYSSLARNINRALESIPDY